MLPPFTSGKKTCHYSQSRTQIGQFENDPGKVRGLAGIAVFHEGGS
jgi:hypothetical protein